MKLEDLKKQADTLTFKKAVFGVSEEDVRKKIDDLIKAFENILQEKENCYQADIEALKSCQITGDIIIYVDGDDAKYGDEAEDSEQTDKGD